MEIVLIVLAVLAAGSFLVWWWMRRNRPAPEEDEWTLPPDTGRPSRLASTPEAEAPRLDRDALVKRPRAFDPSRWDNLPSGGETGEEAEEDLPRFFDRDYLRQRDRGAAAPEQPEAGTGAPDGDGATEGDGGTERG